MRRCMTLIPLDVCFLSPRQLEGLGTENTQLVELKSNTAANNEISFINEFKFECLETKITVIGLSATRYGGVHVVSPTRM